MSTTKIEEAARVTKDILKERRAIRGRVSYKGNDEEGKIVVTFLTDAYDEHAGKVPVEVNGFPTFVRQDSDLYSAESGESPFPEPEW